MGGLSKKAHHPNSIVQREGSPVRIVSAKALKSEQAFVLGRKEKTHFSPWRDTEKAARVRGGKEFISKCRRRPLKTFNDKV